MERLDWYVWQQMLPLLLTQTLNKSQLAQRLGIQYSHTVGILNLLKTNGLVEFHRINGKSFGIWLTEEGKQVAAGFKKAMEAIQ